MEHVKRGTGTKKFLLNAVVFVLLLFVFDRSLFYVIRAAEGKFFKRKDFKKIFAQRRDFNKQFVNLPKGTYNTLIFGSSRTHRGLHPHYIYKRLRQKAFKMAKGKIRIKFNYYFYKEYKKYAGAPRVVIYGLDYFMFKLESHPYFLQYVTGDSGGKYSDGILLLPANKSRIDTLLDNALEQLNGEFSAQKARRVPEGVKIIDPFVGYGKQETFDVRKPDRFETFDYFGYPGVEGIYFTRLLDELEADGVQVILVYLPDYIGTYESNHQRGAFREDIRKITAGYKNITIYDYNSPETFPLSNADYFLDGGYGKTNSHLSRKGSREFNRKLTRDLKKHYKKLK